MPDIIKELNLNKHPKNCKNLSLVYAKNVRVSNDLSCIQNEEGIYEHSSLLTQLTHKIIVGYIPCNKEIIFITTDSIPQDVDHPVTAYIERYNELDDDCDLVYSNYKYYGGEIKGTFTYNINSELILAITEFDNDNNLSIPVHTINLGKWKGTVIDGNLSYDSLSTNPDVIIPSITNFNYVSGTAFKGWYNFFIRFKINNRDYTKWYHIGYPILLDEVFNSTIFRYYQPTKVKTGEKILGQVHGGDAYSKTSTIYDICSKTISLDLNFTGNIGKTYQIGFICTTKKYTKVYKTNDIIASISENFTINFNVLDEYSVEEFILQNYNYYNVKNIINYKNKLYISNYKDSLFNYPELVSFVTNNCSIEIKNDKYIDPEYYHEGTVANPFDIGSVTVHIPVKDSTLTPVFDIDGDIKNSSTLTPTNHVATYIEPKEGIVDNCTCIIKDSNGIIIYSTGNNDCTISAIVSKRMQMDDISTPLTTIDVIIDCEQYNLNATIKLHYDSNGLVDTANVLINEETTPDDFAAYNSMYEYNYDLLKETTLLPGEKYNFYMHFVSKYGEVSEGIKINSSPITIPNVYLNANNKYIKYYPKITVGGTLLTDNEFGYFLSYEKLQKIKSYTGLLYKEANGNDIIYKFYSGEIDLLDSINLQGTSLDIIGEVFDSTGGAVVDYVQEVKTKTIGDINSALDVKSLENKYYFWNLNKYSIYSTFVNKSIKSIELVAAEDYSKSNNGKGSYLKIILTNNQDDTIKNKVYYLANIINSNSGQYKNEIKTLIKFTDIVYSAGEKSFEYGLNGRISLNDTLIYNYKGVVLDTSLNAIFTNNFVPYYASDMLSDPSGYDNQKFKYNYFNNSSSSGENVNVPAPLIIVSFYQYSDILLEGKRINNSPLYYPLNATVPRRDKEYETPTFVVNIITEPKNSIDLFEEVNGSQDFLNPLTYINYDENREYQNEFNKRIQRSNVIQDESIENSWRFFPVEGYKDITENKGIITNIIAIGTTLLAHTEHSLFMFDRDNTLQTNGKDVQLAMPDIFDVDYREVFTSDLGTAGLQDSKAFIVDTFGYIFYDNDAYKLYLFGEKQLKLLDFNTLQFFAKYRPYQIRFANDKSTDRILLDIKYKDINAIKEIVLSYNTNISRFISFHTYNFEEATNTKNNIYLFKSFKQNNTKIYHSLHDYKNGNRDITITNIDSLKNQYYNHFENTFNNFSITEKSQIDIIVNDAYELIKYVEYITYKLYNIEKGDNLQNNLSFPVEEMRTPYAGLKIRVYNGNNTVDRIDTGWIDVSSATWENKDVSQKVMEYKLPYWHNGNWNFNYLRDSVNSGDSRLWGNYFIVSFEFGRELTRTEFETLNCVLSKSENI